MRKFVFLFKKYFDDLRESIDINVKLIKPGKVLKILYGLISFLLISLLLWAVIASYNRGDFLDVGNMYGFVKIIIIYGIFHLILYIGLLASHIIVSKDYIEYVQYFIKRRKMLLTDIRECQTVYLSGVAKTLRIIGKDNITFIDINYSFFNSAKDLKDFVTSIGFPNAFNYEEKRVLTEEEKKKRAQAKKKKARKVLNIINSILFFEDIAVILFFIMSYFFNLNYATKLFLILPIIIGWKLSSIFWKKIKKYSLKKMIILSIVSIILFCLIFFISASLYSYFKFGHI